MNFGLYFIFAILLIECSAISQNDGYPNARNHPSFYQNLRTDESSFSKENVSNSTYIPISSGSKNDGKKLMAMETPSVIKATENMVDFFNTVVKGASGMVSDIIAKAMTGVKDMTKVGHHGNIEPETLKKIGQKAEQLKELDSNMNNDLIAVDADVEDIQHGLPSRMNGEDPHPALYLVDKDLKDISMDLMNTKNDAEAIENDYAELLAAKTSTGKSVQQKSINSQTPIGEAINNDFNIGANATSLNENLASVKSDVDDDF